MTTDQRDERLAEVLDRAVREIRPRPTPEQAIRRGRMRRGVRLVASLVAVSAFVGGTIWVAVIVRGLGPAPHPGSSVVTFASPQAPWTFERPSGWSVETRRLARPELIANMLRTTVANGPLPESAGESGPNSSGNTALTSALGDAGVMVLVQRFWSHGMPTASEPHGPGPFVEDAQSPGWQFRTRARCDGTLCFDVVEWVGPAASEEDRAAAASIADSVRLADDRWTETDGERTTLHDTDDLFTVTYPAGWIASNEPINDWVSSPFEILALATYPLRPGGDAVTDFQLPSNAVSDLGPNDILIWVNDDGDGDGFPERPDLFGPSEPCERWTRLCPEPDGRGLGIPGIRAWWLGFSDAGRGIYVFVGMGEQAYANPAQAQLAWGVVNSLRFLPR